MVDSTRQTVNDESHQATTGLSQLRRLLYTKNEIAFYVHDGLLLPSGQRDYDTTR